MIKIPTVRQKKSNSYQSLKTNPQKLGIIGGGQLARMLIQAADKIGVKSAVICQNLNEPAAQIADQVFLSALDDSQAVLDFVEKMDLVTFESEFLKTDFLFSVEKRNPGKIFPRPRLMKIIQNRKTQKELLLKYRIPTSPFVKVNSVSALKRAWKILGGPFVLKKDYGGYDGYGTFFVKSASDIQKHEKLFHQPSADFIAEKWIPFEKELAIIFIRNSNGVIAEFPLVETNQKNGRCLLVSGPKKHPELPMLKKKFHLLMKKENYVGALAVEMFSFNKKLLVNELAPRVHNSGHYSLDALDLSQFEMHLKAGLGDKLKKPKALTPSFVMMNILGESEKPIQVPKKMKGKVHLYGKLENRPNRKMGHVNYTGDSIEKLLSLAIRESKRIAK